MITCWNCSFELDDTQNYCSNCTHEGNPAPVRLSRYLVQEYLGHGTFGTVYKCWDPSIKRSVAVKKILLPGSQRNAIINEVQMVGSIDHPGIVRVYDADTDNGLIVMEFVSGGTLATKLKLDRPWVRANFTRLFSELGEGLRAAHVQRLIHRDIKPANILLTEDGRPKLADFGVARVLDTNQLAVTRAGSPAYMAPEVIFGQPYGLEADIHSFGCVLYEAWTGLLPFSQPGNAMALALQKQNRAYIALRDVDSSADDVLNELVSGMLAPAGDRISSIEVVLEQLKHRDPSALPGSVPSIDDMQFRIGAIYGLRNRSRSPVLLLGHFQVAIRLAIGSLARQDDQYHQRRAEAGFIRAFSWLCALSSSVNARLSQLVWLKYDGACPYCDAEECQCAGTSRKRDPVRNQELLEKLHDRRLSHAENPQTFQQYQAMFRRIYGRINRESGLPQVGHHAYSEMVEAMDALLHLTSMKNQLEVTKLHLELSDLIAWFFALLNSYRPDYSFVDNFEIQFANGCYACKRPTCECPSIEHELKLASWREFD